MPNGRREESNELTLSDYARAAWRWKWLIAALAIAFAAAGYFYTARQAPQYEASTVLTYVAPLDPANPLANSYVDPSIAQLALENVGSAVSGPAVSSRAKTALAAAPPTHPYTVSAQLSQASSTSSYSSAAIISAVSTSAAETAVVANAYAEAVVAWSRDQQLARVKQAEAATSDALRAFQTPKSKRSADYLLLAQRLQNLRVLASTVTGQFHVLLPATVPAAPFAPRPKRSAILGFAGGLFVGVVLALILSVASTRVRGRQEVTEALGLPIVGVIPDVPDKSLNGSRLIALADPSDAASEALRLLRSNLDYVNVDDVSSLLVTSCVAGEGKSTTVCNLAVTLAMAGHRVVVVDADLRRPRVHEYFGITNDVGLSDVVAGTAQLADALRPIELPAPAPFRRSKGGATPGQSRAASRPHRLVVLTSGPRPPDPGELVASKRFAAVIAGLHKASVEFIIVDSPAFLKVGDAAAMAATIQGLLMVVDTDKVRRPMLQEARSSHRAAAVSEAWRRTGQGEDRAKRLRIRRLGSISPTSRAEPGVLSGRSPWLAPCGAPFRPATDQP